MQADPRYDDVAGEVAAFLGERLAFAVAHGVREDRVCLDPGIGFGKTLEHNLELVRRLDILLALGRPVLIGFSRKSSLGKLAGDPNATTGLAERERRGGGGRLRARRDDPPRPRRAGACRGARSGARPRMSVTVELRGLSLFGRHGVHAHEKEQGQEFVFDVDLEVGERGVSDRLEDAVDYRDVALAVQEVSDARSYDLLEALAAEVADELLRRFGAERVRVRVAKPAVKPGGLDGTAGVSVSRP